MRLAGFAASFLGLWLAAGCAEQLTVPGKCPEFCPGGAPSLHDTVFDAVPGGDSTFVGYTGWDQLPAVLVSDSLPAGETRGWYRFPRRADSVPMNIADSMGSYTIDSVTIGFNMVARDSTVPGLVFFVYRIPLTVDTLTTFPALDGMLTPAALIDSIVVADTVRRGRVRLVLSGSELDRLTFAPEDSGQLAIGIRMRAGSPSGARLGTISGASGPATFTTFVRTQATDSAHKTQSIALSASANGFARNNAAPPADPDLLWVGRTPGARTIFRFNIPSAILDSTTLLRATLELTPAEPLLGLPNDAAGLEVRGIIKDVGAKSTPSFLVRAFNLLPAASNDVFGVDVLNIVGLWRGSKGLPQMMIAALSPEGGSFHQPVFYSSRSLRGTPRIRLTYVRPSAVEQP